MSTVFTPEWDHWFCFVGIAIFVVFVIVMRGKPYPMSIIIVSKKLQH
jgi:hypothetical protein